MIYEVSYEAVDGTYYKSCNSLEEAEETFSFVLTMYRLVPLFEMYIVEWSRDGYKTIKSFENLKVTDKDKIMAQACYSSYNRRFE